MNVSLLLIPALFASASLDVPSDAAFDRGVRERADASVARPAFAQAAEGYRQNWQHTHRRGVALAWGRAAYLAGDNPAAIAAFRTGLNYFPGDAALLSGLRHCRAEVKANGVTATPSEGLRNRLVPRYRWVWAFFGVSLVSFGVWNRFTVRWQLGNVLFALGVSGILGLALWEWTCERERDEDRDAPPCVVRVESALRTGNGETYPPRLPALLPAGPRFANSTNAAVGFRFNLKQAKSAGYPRKCF
jgi:hypothetical protein